MVSQNGQSKPIPTVEVSPATAAKMLRSLLRQLFPGTTFFVRFSRGRIVISYTNGPRREEVQRIAAPFSPPPRWSCAGTEEQSEMRVRPRFSAAVYVERRFSFDVFQTTIAVLCEVHGLQPLNIGVTSSGQFYAKSAYIKTAEGIIDLNAEAHRLLHQWSVYDGDEEGC